MEQHLTGTVGTKIKGCTTRLQQIDKETFLGLQSCQDLNKEALLEKKENGGKIIGKRTHQDWKERLVNALQQTQVSWRTGRAGDEEEQQVRHSQRERWHETSTHCHRLGQQLKETCNLESGKGMEKGECKHRETQSET